MARKTTSLSQIRVGLLALATIVILIVFILSVTGDISIFKNTLSVKTRFAAADGLKTGDEVRLAGVRVGQVSSIDFAQEVPDTKTTKTILITMTLDAAETRGRVRTDSKAVLGQQGFLGDRVIDITTGTTAGQVIADGGEIESEDIAGMAQVFSGANDLLVVFNTVGKQVQDIMGNIQKGQGTIGRLLNDDTLFVNLNRTLADAQNLVKRVQEGEGTLPKLINDPTLYNDVRTLTNEIKGLTADLRAGKGTAGKLLNDEKLYREATDAMTKVNSSLEKLDRVISEVEAGRGTLGKLVKDEQLHSDVQATVASIRSISERLNRGEGTAGKLLHDDKLYNNVNQMSSEMVKMLYDFRQNPRKYLSIKVSLF
jgi:phospholipid/cholesterol/gamma-HCH transport system substrate-binding protein